jgi:DNA-directed RNA polymerase specialized sigma subunit
MDVKEFLVSFREFEKYIDQRLDEHARLKARAERITSMMSEMPRYNGLSREDIIVKKVQLEIDIEDDLKKYKEMRKRVEDVISQLSNKKWQIIMRYRYINGLTFEDIALSLGNDIRHIYRVHGWALEELRKK